MKRRRVPRVAEAAVPGVRFITVRGRRLAVTPKGRLLKLAEFRAMRARQRRRAARATAAGADARTVQGTAHTQADLIDVVPVQVPAPASYDPWTEQAPPVVDEGGIEDFDTDDADPEDTDLVDEAGPGDFDAEEGGEPEDFSVVNRAAPQEFYEPGEEELELGQLETIKGWVSTATQFYRRKWDDAVGQFQAAVGSFLQNRATLARLDQTVTQAREAGRRRGAPPSPELAQLAAEIAKRRAAQGDLESRIRDNIGEIQAAQPEAAPQLGLVPLVIPLALIATIGATAAAALIHTQRVRQLASEVDLAARGVLSPGQIAQIKGAGGGGLIQQAAGLAGKVGLMAVAGIGLMLMLRAPVKKGL